MSPGSLSGRATEIFQEGVRIPPIKVVDRGRPNEAALDLIFSNMRGPRERRGDYQAMLGTCRKAIERIEALVARYGVTTIREAVAELMDRAEAACAAPFAGSPPASTSTRRTRSGHRTASSRSTVRAKVGRRRRHDHRGSRRHFAADTRADPTRPAMAPTGAFRSSSRSRSRLRRRTRGPSVLTVITPPGTIVSANPPAPAVACRGEYASSRP